MAKSVPLAPPDFSHFPPNTVTTFERTICLACVADVFTKLLGVAAKKTAQEMKSYTPSPAELTASTIDRPYFQPAEAKAHCPYCDSISKRHAVLTTYCIEGGRATDSARLALLKSLPVSKGQFAVVEEKASHNSTFFSWLEKMARVEEEEEAWLRNVSRAFLARKLPQVDWEDVFRQTLVLRRSMRLHEGWEIDNKRLFVAPNLYWEIIAVQYLVSRSHHGGGHTLEGRFTLPELIQLLKHSGYLRAIGVHAHNHSDILEALTHHLAGGDGGVKMYYLIDRRNFLAALKELKITEPKAKKNAVAKKAVAKKRK